MDSSSSSSGVYLAQHTPITLSTFYDYDPLLGLLVAAAVLFGLQTVVLAWQAVRSRTVFLSWLVVFAACEAGGYVAFCAFRVSPSLNAYLAELILIILAPNFVTLVNYVVISRIIPWSRFPASSFLARRGKLVPTFFLASDLLCLTLQAIGGSQLSQSQSSGVFDQARFDLGRDLNLAGISAQLGFQTVFALLALYVYVRMPAVQLRRELRWAWLCMALTMVLVSVRNIYRIIEFASGRHASIDDTSVPYFVLDTLLMLLTAAVFIALDLGSDWVLPSYIRKGAMMDTAAEQANGEAEVSTSSAAAAAAHASKGKGEGAVVVEMQQQQQPHDLHTAHTPTSESESATRAEHSV